MTMAAVTRGCKINHNPRRQEYCLPVFVVGRRNNVFPEPLPAKAFSFPAGLRYSKNGHNLFSALSASGLLSHYCRDIRHHHPVRFPIASIKTPIK
jgi:hypothetical protein